MRLILRDLHTTRLGSTPTFLYFDLYLYSAYTAHYVYYILQDLYYETYTTRLILCDLYYETYTMKRILQDLYYETNIFISYSSAT